MTTTETEQSVDSILVRVTSRLKLAASLVHEYAWDHTDDEMGDATRELLEQTLDAVLKQVEHLYEMLPYDLIAYSGEAIDQWLAEAQARQSRKKA